MATESSAGKRSVDLNDLRYTVAFPLCMVLVLPAGIIGIVQAGTMSTTHISVGVGTIEALEFLSYY